MWFGFAPLYGILEHFDAVFRFLFDRQIDFMEIFRDEGKMFFGTHDRRVCGRDELQAERSKQFVAKEKVARSIRADKFDQSFSVGNDIDRAVFEGTLYFLIIGAVLQFGSDESKGRGSEMFVCILRNGKIVVICFIKQSILYDHIDSNDGNIVTFLQRIELFPGQIDADNAVKISLLFGVRSDRRKQNGYKAGLQKKMLKMAEQIKDMGIVADTVCIIVESDPDIIENACRSQRLRYSGGLVLTEVADLQNFFSDFIADADVGTVIQDIGNRSGGNLRFLRNVRHRDPFDRSGARRFDGLFFFHFDGRFIIVLLADG